MKCPHCGRESSIIDIGGLDKACILQALYKRARSRSVGFIEHSELSIEEARALLKKQSYFEKIGDKSLKVDLSGNELDTTLYDRDNGVNAAEEAILDAIDKM